MASEDETSREQNKQNNSTFYTGTEKGNERRHVGGAFLGGKDVAPSGKGCVANTVT